MKQIDWNPSHLNFSFCINGQWPFLFFCLFFTGIHTFSVACVAVLYVVVVLFFMYVVTIQLILLSCFIIPALRIKFIVLTKDVRFIITQLFNPFINLSVFIGYFIDLAYIFRVTLSSELQGFLYPSAITLADFQNARTCMHLLGVLRWILRIHRKIPFSV